MIQDPAGLVVKYITFLEMSLAAASPIAAEAASVSVSVERPAWAVEIAACSRD